MGLIVPQNLTIKWHNSTKNWYISKGYPYTKNREEFVISVLHLPEKSSVSVKVECDGCFKVLNVIMGNYTKCKKENNEYYCVNCSAKMEIQNRTLTRLKNSISFEQWCIQNSRVDLVMRFNNDLNNIKPSEIGYSSNKKYWFDCPRGIHVPELKSIQNFTSRKCDGDVRCRQCNSFAQWGIDNFGEDFLDDYWDYEKNDIDPWGIDRGTTIKLWLICQNKKYHESYLVSGDGFTNKESRCPYCASKKIHPKDSLGQYIIDNFSEDFLWRVWSDKNNKSPFEYPSGSKYKVWWECPDDIHEPYFRKIIKSKISKFRCGKCSYVGKSNGEKVIDNYFIEFNINYTSQMTFDNLRGLGDGHLSYDFYLPTHNLLIEYQGKQHDSPVQFNGKSKDKAIEEFVKQQEHDRRKREYAKQNNIDLLEIWYYDFDRIEEILSKELNIK